MANFNPKDHMTKLQGRDYLPVMARVAWYRETFPNGQINTDFIVVGELVIAKTSVSDNEGNFLASGSATVRDASDKERAWAGRIVEKAETAAIGRALANAGFGTLAAGDDEGEYLADTPQAPKSAAKQQSKQAPKNDHTDILDDKWNKDEMKKFWYYWTNTKQVADETVLKGLGVNKLSEWQGSFEAAKTRMNEYFESIK